MKIALLTALVFLGLSSSAGAVTLNTASGETSQPFQSWADASHVPTVTDVLALGDDVSVCGGAAAECASRSGWIAIDPAYAAKNQHYLLLHALGHEFDYSMPEWKRTVFAKVVGIEAPWVSDRTHSYFALSELFADMYASCAATGRPRERHAEDGRLISARTGRRVCKLIRQPN